MTFLITLALGAGALFVISALEDTSLSLTFMSILTNAPLDLSGNAGAKPVPSLAGVFGIGNGGIPNPFQPGGPPKKGLGPPTLAQYVVGGESGYIDENGQVIGMGTGGVQSRGAGIVLTEWGNRIGGAIASCVETSGEILRAMSTGQRVGFSDVQAAWADLYARKQATDTGVTSWSAESAQLRREGVANTYYSQFNRQALQTTIAGGKGVVLGFSNAQELQDVTTGTWYNAGIHGHSITVEAYDDIGVWAADPNTPYGIGLVHYTWDAIRRAKPVAMIAAL